MSTRLYLLSPPGFDLSVMKQTLPAVMDAAEIPCFQLRLKDADDDMWRKAIETLKPICVQRNTAFIVNDRADLAKEFDCDGVHVGQTDMSYEEARKLLGDKKIVGASAYASTDTAMELAAAGADYVAFGSVFPSATKELAPPVALEVLESWVEMASTPVVAIGGITAGNCAPLVRAGVDFLAVIGAVWSYPAGPVEGVKLFQNAINTQENI